MVDTDTLYPPQTLVRRLGTTQQINLDPLLVASLCSWKAQVGTVGRAYQFLRFGAWRCR